METAACVSSAYDEREEGGGRGGVEGDRDRAQLSHNE